MNASGANPSLNELRAKLVTVRSQAFSLEEEIARLEQQGQMELARTQESGKSVVQRHSVSLQANYTNSTSDGGRSA